MKSGKISFIITFLCLPFLAQARHTTHLTVAATRANAYVAALDASFHQKYGCAYPITYQFEIPANSRGLTAWHKHATGEPWEKMAEKTSQDFFNAVEVVRFDYPGLRAYVSAAFSASTDSLFVQITDSLSDPLLVPFDGICKYYDHRSAVVTVSADDWSDWVVLDGRFSTLIDIFRSYHLYVTVGVITGVGNITRTTWSILQQQLDSGYVEAASHSRTHPPTPYADPVGEIVGSSEDIRNALSLPSLFTMGGTGYVYTWIAPYGNFDQTVDSLTGVSGYLADRIYANGDTASPREYVYGDSTLSPWNPVRNHFAPFLPTVELGSPSWGGGDTSVSSLNDLFDSILSKGDVYHCMWHPQVLYDDRDMHYLRSHLDHISNRTNVWYANLGHLYLYTLMQGSAGRVIMDAPEQMPVPRKYALLQNFPNPFNPSTTIRYDVPTASNVTIRLYNVLGQKVTTLVHQFRDAGSYTVPWNASALSSGVYICTLEAEAMDGSKSSIAHKVVYAK